jgi:hypothetical protein
MCRRELLHPGSEDYLTLLRKLQTVTNNHEKLSCWTVEMEGAISNLAQQFVEQIGLPMAEEGELHVPEEQQLHH